MKHTALFFFTFCTIYTTIVLQAQPEQRSRTNQQIIAQGGNCEFAPALGQGSLPPEDQSNFRFGVGVGANANNSKEGRHQPRLSTNTIDLNCRKHDKKVWVPLEEYDKCRTFFAPTSSAEREPLNNLIHNACQEQHEPHQGVDLDFIPPQISEPLVSTKPATQTSKVIKQPTTPPNQNPQSQTGSHVATGVQDVKTEKEATAQQTKPHFGVTPALEGEVSIECRDGEAFVALVSSAGHIVYKESEAFGNTLKKGAETLVTIFGVAQHALDGSKHLRMKQEQLRDKQKRGEPLNQLEQARLQWIPQQLAARERLLTAWRHTTAADVAERVAEYAITALPDIILSKIEYGVYIAQLMQGLDISADIAHKTLENMETVERAAQTNSREALEEAMIAIHAPIDSNIAIYQSKHGQLSMVQKIQQQLINDAHVQLMNGDLAKAADITAMSALIHAVVSGNESNLYNTETDQFLQRMIKTEPRCQELVEEGALAPPEHTSLVAREAACLVTQTVMSDTRSHQFHTQSKPKSVPDALIKGVIKGWNRIQERKDKIANQVEVIYTLASSCWTDPAKTSKALVKTATKEGFRIAMEKRIERVFDRTSNETASRLQGNIRKSIGNQLLELGASIDRSESPLATATADLFQELASKCNSDNSQIAKALGKVVLEFAGKAEELSPGSGRKIARDVLLHAAVFVTERGGDVAEATGSLCSALVDVLGDAISEQIDNPSGN